MTISISSFPDYLGYGIKFKDSCRFNPDTGIHYCRYVLNGETVLEAEISEKEARIRTLFKGVVIRCASAEKLQKAVFEYYKDEEWLENPIYFAWLQDLMTLNNVYIDVFQRSDFGFLFYPDVYYTTIHIPLKPDKVSLAKNFVVDNDYYFFKPWLQRVLLTTEYFHKPDEEETIEFLSLISPVAFTPWILRKFENSGMVDHDKRYRVIVGATEFVKSRRKKKFLGSDQDEWMAYGIEYQPLNPSMM